MGHHTLQLDYLVAKVDADWGATPDCPIRCPNLTLQPENAQEQDAHWGTADDRDTVLWGLLVTMLNDDIRHAAASLCRSCGQTSATTQHLLPELQLYLVMAFSP